MAVVFHAGPKAINVLREQDHYRSQRLSKPAFRYILMTIDLCTHEELQPIAQLLVVLYVLLQEGGDRPPEVEPSVLASVLIAIDEARLSGEEKASA